MDEARVGEAAGVGLVAGDGGVAMAPGRAAALPGYLGHRARLRRRLVGGGPAALLDHELLELVLFHALPRRDTKPMAEALARRFGGFAGAVGAPPAALDAAVPGLGEAGVAALKAVEAAALRLNRAALPERPLLDSRARLLDYLAAAPPDHNRAARARVLFLDRRGRLIADEAQGAGAAGSASVQPREVVRRALEVGAAALILVRGQPGGVQAAPEAVAAAEELGAAAAAFGIALRDHLTHGGGRTAARRERPP